MKKNIQTRLLIAAGISIAFTHLPALAEMATASGYNNGYFSTPTGGYPTSGTTFTGGYPTTGTSTGGSPVGPTYCDLHPDQCLTDGTTNTGTTASGGYPTTGTTSTGSINSDPGTSAVGPSYCQMHPDQCLSDESPTPTPTLPPPSTPVPIGTPVPGTTTYFNPTLNGCIQAIRPTSSTYVRATSEFDCPHTPTDAVGVINAADKDYKQWNDRFLPGTSTTPMDGAYSLRGQRCGDQNALSENCPISMRVKFVYTCDKGDTMNWKASLGKCAIARSLKVYRATYQAISVPGKMSMKPMIIADKNVSPNALEAAPVPMAGISSINYSGKSEIKCSDYQKPGEAPYFQVGQDPYGNPICSQDATVTEMQKQICNQMMSGIWSTGGTSASPCPIISVSKVFRLSNTGKTDKTTTDCTNAGGNIFTSSGAEVTSLSSFPGGTLSGAITSESEFRTKYSISTASPTFTCKVKTTSDQTQEFKASGVLLLKNFVAGSLKIDGMVGGGAGGGSSDQDNGGIGGGAGGFVSGTLSSVVSDQSCTVTIGSGGVGANANDSGGCCERGADGGVTRVACAEQASQASGGIRGSDGNDGCRGTASGSGGASSYYGPGGSGPGCGVGGTATSYGAGGGGGGTDGVWCGCHSGGSGSGGYVKASWKIFNWVNW